MVLTGKQAPDFKAMTAFKGDCREISLSDYRGKNYVILFFYPLDFTFVCPTELHAFQEKLSEFKNRSTEVFSCSVDSHFSHLAWLNTPKNKGGIEGIEYGLISDIGGSIAEAYDVLSPEKVSYRGLFLIDKEGVVRHQVVNDLPLGRSVDEALRMVDALQHYEENGEVCPANWRKGEEAIETTHQSVGRYLENKK